MIWKKIVLASRIFYDVKSTEDGSKFVLGLINVNDGNGYRSFLAKYSNGNSADWTYYSDNTAFQEKLSHFTIVNSFIYALGSKIDGSLQQVRISKFSLDGSSIELDFYVSENEDYYNIDSAPRFIGGLNDGNLFVVLSLFSYAGCPYKP